MRTIKNLFYLFLIIFFVTINIHTTCYGAKITENNLSTAFNSLASDLSSNDYKFSLSEDTVKISSNSTSYTINYNLESNPTFYVSIPVEEGMSYDEFKDNVSDNLLLPRIGYLAIAYTQGITAKDAITYFDTQLSGKSFEQSLDSDYIIIDDDSSDLDNDEKNVIYKSEFGNKVMEYVNSLYSEEKSISDSNEKNTFLWTVKQSNVTDTSCTLISSLEVNTDSDFSSLKLSAPSTDDDDITDDNFDDDSSDDNDSNSDDDDFSDEDFDSLDDDDEDLDNNDDNDFDTLDDDDNDEDDTPSNTQIINQPVTPYQSNSPISLPKAGIRNVVIVSLILVILPIIVVLRIKNKQYRNIK